MKISGGEFREKSLGARLPENAAAQISRENYLIPIDAKFQAEEDLAEQGVKLADIVAALEATQTKVRIVVVDACRDNPFGGSAADDTGGFALVDAPEGALIAYSTSPGTAAFDGLGKHSPYAAAFMRTARTPNLPVEQVFKKVRLLVNDSTDKKQLPWDSARLNTQFAFFANAETPVAAVAAPTKVSVADLGSRPARLAYEIAIAEDKEEYYEEFVRLYQSDPLAEHIRRVLNRRKQMVAWQNVTHRNRPEDYADFARRFNNSGLERAARRLQERPRPISIAFPRRGEGRFGDGRFGIKVAVANNGRPVINLPGRGNGNIGSRQVISFPQNGGGNNGGRPVINQNGQNGQNGRNRNPNSGDSNNNGGRPAVVNRNGQNQNANSGISNGNGGGPVEVNQNGKNSGGRRVINQNGQNNPSNASGRENGRGRRNIGNVNVEQGRRVNQRQPQVLRNTQLQQRAPQIRRQVIQEPRQFAQPRVSSGGGSRR